MARTMEVAVAVMGLARTDARSRMGLRLAPRTWAWYANCQRSLRAFSKATLPKALNNVKTRLRQPQA